MQSELETRAVLRQKHVIDGFQAPEFFYRCLEEKLKLKVEDILDFTDALDALLS